MNKILLGAVGVLVLLALFVLGYLALASPEAASDPLVTKGVQKVVICGEKRERGNWLYKITEEVPGGDSGEWGTKGHGYCNTFFHYAGAGPAD